MACLRWAQHKYLTRAWALVCASSRCRLRLCVFVPFIPHPASLLPTARVPLFQNENPFVVAAEAAAPVLGSLSILALVLAGGQIARGSLLLPVSGSDGSRSCEMAVFQLFCLPPVNTCCLSCCSGNSLPFVRTSLFSLLNYTCCLP